MSISRKIAWRDNGGDPVEIDLGTEAASVRMQDGSDLIEYLTTHYEPQITGAAIKSTPADADSFAISDYTASGETKRLPLSSVKTWLKGYFDGLYLSGSSDGSSLKPSFTESSARSNIYSGLTLGTILGRIQKFFSDLKSVAFTGSYSDLINKPTTMPPAPHKASHQTGGSDDLSPADIGAAAVGHSHTPASLGAATADHTHTPASLGAAPADKALLLGDSNGMAGKFDRLSTAPSATTALRYNGYFRATRVYGMYYSDDADYAEGYPIEGDIEAGELVAIKPDGTFCRNTIQDNRRLLGIVSTAPASVIGMERDEYVPVALAGRVPVKVIGKICPGDFLAASWEPGKAMTASEDSPRGTIIGQALSGCTDGGVIAAMVLRM